jgi:hypothetical protein
LQHGPISLSFVRGAIERAMAGELGGRTVKIDDVEILFADNHRLTLALRNVAVNDVDGAPLIQAPRANFSLSRTALARGHVAVRRVDLIGPRIHVFYSETGAISLKFTPAVDVPAVGEPPARNAANATVVTAKSRQVGHRPDDTRSIDLVKALADASRRARRGADATADLRFVGLKQAVVVVYNGKRKSVWNVPEAQLDLDHKGARSQIAGQATVASLTGPWMLAFTTVDAEQSDAVQLGVTIRDLNPRGLGRMLPSWSWLEGFDVPLVGEAKLELPIAGGVRSATIDVSVGKGQALVAAGKSRMTTIESGLLHAVYDGGRRRFDLKKLALEWAQNRVELAGAAVAQPVVGDQAPVWRFDLGSTGGQLGSESGDGKPIPLDLLQVRGSVVPTQARLSLETAHLSAGSAEIIAMGEVTDLASGPRYNIDGRVGPMSSATLKAVWPQAMAPVARDWVIAHVRKAQLSGGQFKIATSGGPTAIDPDAVPEMRVSATIEGSGIELMLANGVPPVDVPRALIRIEGQTVEITAPDASLTAADNKKLQAKGLRFTAVETAVGDQPTGEIAFRVLGSLGAAADVADREAFQLLKSRGIALPGLDGKIDGQLKITLPLADNVQLSEIRTEGRLRVSDIRAKQIFGNLDLSGGTFNVDLNDKAADVKGDMLIRGVLAKLNWQYLFNATADRQPPVRITTLLDTSDRAQLGLDLADIVLGEVPIEITIQNDSRGESVTRVRADLTKAELMLDAIAWKKPPGKTATIQFEPAKGPGVGPAQRLELQNVKLVGDDIAVEGWMALGPDNKLREMSFPQFSVNVVTRLDVHGKLRPDNVWDVKAKGATFDGRDMFRAMFNLGQLSERPQVPPPKDKPGLDLVAEVDTVIGFSDTSIRNVRIRAGRRQDKLTDLDLKSTLPGNQPFVATVVAAGVNRQLRAHALDAGQVFKLVGFYPNAVGGEMQLEVNLDAKGANEKSGILWTRNFAVLGDPVISEVLQDAETGPSSQQGGKKRVVRSRFDFDQMKIPFDVGSGQFVMNDAYLRGPLVGATWRGKVDFKSQVANIGGTYAPLSGLNSAIGGILGPLSGGLQGEGLFGITFAVQGPMANPQVIVNPFSLVAPGIFREIFQMTPESFKVSPRSNEAAPRRKGEPARSSSAPVVERKAQGGTRAQPESTSEWSSEVKKK